MSDRLPAKLEATAIMRQVESAGGFATIIKRGDPESGALILLIAERGLSRALLERQMGDDFVYRWAIAVRPDSANPEKFRQITDKATRFDPDCWLIELDIVDAERFIAETIALP
ncbi:MAG: DUF1491 family protein [Sphingomonas bacterium]|nr:DUF1491 family protein [Sphingomonas bacterium]